MNIKLHLDKAEYDPIERTAEAYGCAVEDVVYTAVNEYMLRIGRDFDIMQTAIKRWPSV